MCTKCVPADSRSSLLCVWAGGSKAAVLHFWHVSIVLQEAHRVLQQHAVLWRYLRLDMAFSLATQRVVTLRWRTFRCFQSRARMLARRLPVSRGVEISMNRITPRRAIKR